MDCIKLYKIYCYSVYHLQLYNDFHETHSFVHFFYRVEDLHTGSQSGQVILLWWQSTTSWWSEQGNMTKGLVKCLKDQIIYWAHWSLLLTAGSPTVLALFIARVSLSCSDREIQLYELSTLEPYCQINALDTVPLTLDYGWATELHVNTSSKCHNKSQHT